MSRSYKHYPISKDPNDSYFKRYYNKKVRRTPDIPDGRTFRKLNNSWNISDYSFFYSWESWKRGALRDNPNVDLKKEYVKWRRWYCNK